MATNSVYGLRNPEIQIQSKPGFVERVVRACWEANQRTYLAATTDPKTTSSCAYDAGIEIQTVGYYRNGRKLRPFSRVDLDPPACSLIVIMWDERGLLPYLPRSCSRY